MKERDFCYWLQGFVEMRGERPTEEQWKQIKDHLALVFDKVTPNRSYPNEEGGKSSKPAPYPTPDPPPMSWSPMVNLGDTSTEKPKKPTAKKTKIRFFNDGDIKC